MAIAGNNHWLAYNAIPYFLDKGDVYFFKDRSEADEFADNNINDYDDYKVIYTTSVADVFRQIPYGGQLTNYLNHDAGSLELSSISSSKNFTIMNDKNLEYLKSNLKYQGFGEKLNSELETNMKQGLPEFQLKIQTEYNKEKIEAVLHFKKSDQSDMYFFNRYDATLQKTNEEKLSQTFYLNKGNGVTIKEAYNLLNGRAVNKELTSMEG